MPDFKAMYVRLFQSQTKAIRILQEAQQATEEMYISAELPDIKLFTLLKGEDGGAEASDEDDKKD